MFCRLTCTSLSLRLNIRMCAVCIHRIELWMIIRLLNDGDRTNPNPLCLIKGFLQAALTAGCQPPLIAVSFFYLWVRIKFNEVSLSSKWKKNNMWTHSYECYRKYCLNTKWINTSVPSMVESNESWFSTLQRPHTSLVLGISWNISELPTLSGIHGKMVSVFRKGEKNKYSS